MDFHSLPRRYLQFLCKRNKIPANMTNLAMADALKALEIVEGLNEYMNQSNSNVLQSPTSVAKLPPKTATRTTRRKTAVKAEPQSSSQLVNRSCRLTSKSLDGEMDQENMNKNVAQEPKTNNVKSETCVAKTPAARSTRKAPAAAACSSKVQESKKGEMVQSAYSTRRSTRLLEKSMAGLSLKTKETFDSNKPEKNEETVSAQEKNPADWGMFGLAKTKINIFGSDSEWRAYNWPRKESQWDVDSYDDYEFKINPRIRKLYPSDETFEDYCKDRLKAFQSKGFLPDHMCDIYSVLLDSEPPLDNEKVNKTAGELMADLTKLCVEKFNETEVKILEFVNVVRATENIGPEYKYYITFMAREYPNGHLVEYQAKVIKYLGDDKPPFPILCRPSPPPQS